MSSTPSRRAASMRCMFCGRGIAAALPTGELAGPTCARKVGLLPPITRRRVTTITGGRAYKCINQVDWVDVVSGQQSEGV